MEQKLLNKEKLKQNREFIEENTHKTKEALLQDALIKQLQLRYPVEIYLKESE